MGISRTKVVNLTILGATTTLVGTSAMIVTILVVSVMLYAVYKFASKPTIDISIG